LDCRQDSGLLRAGVGCGSARSGTEGRCSTR
jgi:hypothetical protein